MKSHDRKNLKNLFGRKPDRSRNTPLPYSSEAALDSKGAKFLDDYFSKLRQSSTSTLKTGTSGGSRMEFMPTAIPVGALRSANFAREWERSPNKHLC